MVGDWEALIARLEQLEERVEELEREREERGETRTKRDAAVRKMMSAYDERMAKIRAEFESGGRGGE
jgi:predicted nuclease with TOPRIM domain